MKKLIGLLSAWLCMIQVNAQAPKQDKEAINKLCGCFEVEFKYAETFSPNDDYKFHERERINGGVELSMPIEVTDTKIVIQHLLVITDSIIVKHWREVWTYENPELWVYKGDRTWVKEMLTPSQVKGKWTQTIWEVSDEPRYQGLSQFVNLDGKLIWQNTTDAPLPRREYSVRSDYNILKRTNRLNISDKGYIHEQDNEKVLRSNGKDKLIVQERGLNTYDRIDDAKCSPAKKYWDRYQGFWSKVRNEWTRQFNGQNSISLKFKVQDKLLHEYLLKLSDEYVAKKVGETEIDARIKTEIEKFLGKEEIKSVGQQ